MRDHRLLIGLAALGLLGLLPGSDGASARTQAGGPTAGGAGVAIQQQAGPSLQGDVNCSGVTDSIDALQVLRSVALLPFTADCLQTAADVSCDGSIDSLDALAILRIVAGLLQPGTCSGEPAPTSLDLIGQALHDGDMNEETAALYAVFATFDDPRLPSRYEGGPPIDFESQVDLTSIASQLDSFSPDVRAQVEPFLIAPMHAGSWWDQRYHSQAEPAGGDVPGPVLDGDWTSIATDNDRVRLWYPVDDFAMFQLANSTKQEIDSHIWPQLVALMGREPLPDGGALTPGRGGDDLTDIVISKDMPTFGAIGLLPGLCERTAGFILASPDEAERLGVPFNVAIGHELMHVFQFALDLANRAGGNGGCGADEYIWWAEASAVWVEDYLYPSANSEHTGARGERQVRDFMTDLTSSLDKGQDTGFVVALSSREYGAYLWAFYAARKFGNEVIGEMWRRMESQGSLQAMDGALPEGFDKAWPEFAVWMLNKAPFDFLRQLDGIQQDPDTFRDQGFGFYSSFRDHDERVELGGSVHYAEIGVSDGSFTVDWGGEDHLAMTYNSYLFTDPQIASVAVYNGMTFSVEDFDTGDGSKIWTFVPRPEEETRGLMVQALIKYTGQDWLLEDWTFYPYKNFCRDVTAERIEELIIITSNSVPEKGYKVSPPGPEIITDDTRVWVSDMGCNRWEGSLEQVETAESGFRMETKVTGLVLERDPSQASPPCCGGYNVNYLPVAGTLEWRASGTQGECSVSGSGTAPLEQHQSFFTYNYYHEGPHYRTAVGTVGTDVEQHYMLNCPDETFVYSFYPTITFPLSDTPVQVFEVGSSFFGTSHYPPYDVTWDIQAVQQ